MTTITGKSLKRRGTLKHGFVRERPKKIRDLGRLLGFIKGVKNGSYESPVRINDAAAAIGIVLESKGNNRH